MTAKLHFSLYNNHISQKPPFLSRARVSKQLSNVSTSAQFIYNQNITNDSLNFPSVMRLSRVSKKRPRISPRPPVVYSTARFVMRKARSPLTRSEMMSYPCKSQ